MIALPNGEFIRPESIISIRLGDRDKQGNKSRVIIDYGVREEDGSLFDKLSPTIYNSIVVDCSNNIVRGNLAASIANHCGTIIGA